MNKARKISDLIKPGKSGFARVMAKATRIQRLDEMLAKALNPELVDHVRTAGLDGGVLKLVTSSAAIATRLRLDTPDLIRAMRSSGAGNINEIRVIVAPLEIGKTTQAGKRELSTAAREALDRYFLDVEDRKEK